MRCFCVTPELIIKRAAGVARQGPPLVTVKEPITISKCTEGRGFHSIVVFIHRLISSLHYMLPSSPPLSIFEELFVPRTRNVRKVLCTFSYFGTLEFPLGSGGVSHRNTAPTSARDKNKQRKIKMASYQGRALGRVPQGS